MLGFERSWVGILPKTKRLIGERHYSPPLERPPYNRVPSPCDFQVFRPIEGALEVPKLKDDAEFGCRHDQTYSCLFVEKKVLKKQENMYQND